MSNYQYTKSYSTVDRLNTYLTKHNLTKFTHLIVQIPDLPGVPKDQVGRFTAIFGASGGDNAWIAIDHGFKVIA